MAEKEEEIDFLEEKVMQQASEAASTMATQMADASAKVLQTEKKLHAATEETARLKRECAVAERAAPDVEVRVEFVHVDLAGSVLVDLVKLAQRGKIQRLIVFALELVDIHIVQKTLHSRMRPGW